MGASALLLLAAPLLAAQRDDLLGDPYPFEIRPLDAAYGHLIEGAFREPLGLSFDAVAQELLVADSKAGRVGIFDAEGLPLFAFGGPRVLSDPRRLCADANGRIFVLDSEASQLKVFSYRGEPLEPLYFPAPPGEVGSIANIGSFERDAAGNWYIIDAEKQRALVYGPNLDFLFALRPGKEPFGRMTALAVAADGVIAVLDFRGSPVRLFDPEGHFLLAFGDRSLGLQGFAAPMAVEFDEYGYLFVVDMLRHDIKIFDREGRFCGRFGGWFGPYTGGRNPGEMLYPVDVAIAPQGAIYVAERFGNRVQLFSREARPGQGAPPAAGAPIEAASPRNQSSPSGESNGRNTGPDQRKEVPRRAGGDGGNA